MRENSKNFILIHFRCSRAVTEPTPAGRSLQSLTRFTNCLRIKRENKFISSTICSCRRCKSIINVRMKTTEAIESWNAHRTWSFSIRFFFFFPFVKLNLIKLERLIFIAVQQITLRYSRHGRSSFQAQTEMSTETKCWNICCCRLKSVLKRCPMTKRPFDLPLFFWLFLRLTTFGECECTIQYQFYVNAKRPLALHPNYCIALKWGDRRKTFDDLRHFCQRS